MMDTLRRWFVDGQIVGKDAETFELATVFDFFDYLRNGNDKVGNILENIFIRIKNRGLHVLDLHIAYQKIDIIYECRRVCDQTMEFRLRRHS